MPTCYKTRRGTWELDTIEKCKEVLFARTLMLKRNKYPFGGIAAALDYLYDLYPDFKAANCTQDYIAREILGISRCSLAHALKRRRDGERGRRQQEQEAVRPEAEENTAG